MSCKSGTHLLRRCKHEALNDPCSSDTIRQAAAISVQCSGALKRLDEPVVAPPNAGLFILRYGYQLLDMLHNMHSWPGLFVHCLPHDCPVLSLPVFE
jgi:hypothetical protein